MTDKEFVDLIEGFKEKAYEYIQGKHRMVTSEDVSLLQSFIKERLARDLRNYNVSCWSCFGNVVEGVIAMLFIPYVEGAKYKALYDIIYPTVDNTTAHLKMVPDDITDAFPYTQIDLGNGTTLINVDGNPTDEQLKEIKETVKKTGRPKKK